MPSSLSVVRYRFFGQPRRRAAPSGRRIALVIGNGSYQSVARLPNPANDARLIASTLQRAGFTLVGDGPQLDLNKAQFDRLIQQFGRQLPGADVALFYYSGHGMQVQGVNWLVPVDANPTSAKDMDFQMVDASLVLRQMEDAGTQAEHGDPRCLPQQPICHSWRACRPPEGLGGVSSTRGHADFLRDAARECRAPDGKDSGDSPYTVALAKAIERPGLGVFLCVQ